MDTYGIHVSVFIGTCQYPDFWGNMVVIHCSCHFGKKTQIGEFRGNPHRGSIGSRLYGIGHRFVLDCKIFGWYYFAVMVSRVYCLFDCPEQSLTLDIVLIWKILLLISEVVKN